MSLTVRCDTCSQSLGPTPSLSAMVAIIHQHIDKDACLCTKVTVSCEECWAILVTGPEVWPQGKAKNAVDHDWEWEQLHTHQPLET
jgi:hypothetical protein